MRRWLLLLFLWVVGCASAQAQVQPCYFCLTHSGSAPGSLDPAQLTDPTGGLTIGGIVGAVTISPNFAVIPIFSSGTSAVPATGEPGTFYFKTDGPAYYYQTTDTPVAVATSVATVVPNTGTASTTALQSGYVFTNTGDGDGSELDLLNDPTIGVTYSVVVTAAQTITVAPAAGESLYLNAAVCTNVTSATVGAALSVVAVTAGSGAIWVASGAGWTCN